MATLSTQTITRAGLGPTYANAAGGGDKCKPSERTFLHVKNGDASPTTVTVVTPGNYEGQSIEDLAVSVPASGERLIGPISPSLFRNPDDDGLASITYSGVTSLTIAVLQI
jgi:hypothetical protein